MDRIHIEISGTGHGKTTTQLAIRHLLLDLGHDVTCSEGDLSIEATSKMIEKCYTPFCIARVEPARVHIHCDLRERDKNNLEKKIIELRGILCKLTDTVQTYKFNKDMSAIRLTKAISEAEKYLDEE